MEPQAAGQFSVADDTRIRRILMGLVLVLAGLTLLGSLAPFRYQGPGWERAVAWLQRTAWFQPTPWQWGDGLNNVLLFLPFGMLLQGALTYRRGGGPRAIGAVAVVLLATFLQALLNEFLQHWFPPRVPNPADVQANLLGALVGVGLWEGGRGWLEARLPHWLRSEVLPGGLGLALLVVLAGWVLWSLMPLAITVHPVDLIRKVSEGALVWNPLSKKSWLLWGADPARAVGGLLAGALVGVWTTRFARPPHAPARPWVTGTLLAVFLLMVLELLQLLFSSRGAATVDVLVGGVGAAVGAALGRFAAGPNRTRLLPGDWLLASSLAALLALLLHSLFLCYHFWKPLELLKERSQIERKLLGLKQLPFVGWMGDRTLPVVVYDGAEKLLLFTLLGACLRGVVEPLGSRGPASLLRRGPTWGLGCLFVLFIEVTQAVWRHRSPESTDVCLGVAGVTAGFWLYARLRALVARLFSLGMASGDASGSA
ncbi:MAG: VanZ family protein [Planctomycetaceae bacterium]